MLNMHSDAHRETNIDVFVTEPFDFDREYAAAYIQELVLGLKLPVASLDTLIEMKRLAGRTKDLADIEELVSIRERIRDQ
ncbi:hypothetical protein C8D93_1116 [Sinimarinibacterium flocculans]|uniref:Uncharacterized protein n=1 Tax=Sinimarinibacterium flocculans TaxID=985250 RepID=A0A318E7C1_9GAMM|nr:hypothetical protein C8D93_1116 [Sinimarinibacterium flocculans]